MQRPAAPSMNRPTEPSAAAPAAEPKVRSIAASRPWAWLKLAYRDLSASPGPSLLHGLLISLGGLIVLTLTLRVWQLMPGALSGFLLIGPIICTGLYELSRRRKVKVSFPRPEFCTDNGAMIAFASFVFFIGIVFYTLFFGKRITENNYWNEYADTLEWTLTSPPPEHTFEQLPKQSDWDKGHAH